MPKSLNNPFAEKDVCKILLKNGLISQDQVKEIFKKSISVERKLAKKNVGQQVSFASGAKSAVSTNIIDIIRLSFHEYAHLNEIDGSHDNIQIWGYNLKIFESIAEYQSIIMNTIYIAELIHKKIPGINTKLLLECLIMIEVSMSCVIVRGLS